MIDAADSVLCVIDVQPGFVQRVSAGQELVDRIERLCEVAAALGIPIVATEEEAEKHGATIPALPPGTPVFPKPVFGAASVPEILAALEAHGRGTFVLTGLETDVCVAQSALGLLERGHRVAVVRDAVGSPGDAHDHGLERMRDAGAVLLGAKGLYFEWVRDVAVGPGTRRPDLGDPWAGAGHGAARCGNARPDPVASTRPPSPRLQAGDAELRARRQRSPSRSTGATSASTTTEASSSSSPAESMSTPETARART